MAKYTYTHKVPTTATIKHEGKEIDINLHEGETNELPESHEFIKLLVVQGKLVEVKEKPVITAGK